MNLVTGGAGFIGSHLVNKLLKNNQSVCVLEHPDADVNHLPLDQIELIRADIRDKGAVRKATQGCDYVYHLAADPNLWRRNRAEFDDINHQGTVNVVEAALANGTKKVLHTSTESILTSPESNGGAVEHVRFEEEGMLGPYCLSKYRAEEAMFNRANEGAPIVVVAPTLPVGPGDRQQTPPTRMSVAFCRGELPAYLECRFNLIDARDVAKGMILAMQHGRPGIRYLLGHENYHLSDWLGILGGETGRTVPRWKVPYPLALTAAWFSELWADHVSKSMPMATVTGVRLTRRSMFFDPAISLKELGLKPRSIRKSAHDAVTWYKKQGWF
ncbi:MAG: NAD-dependent epimerase/dehydratase family protein [Gammaproteobacteria bacterium]|nr:NAD-dependent epimerase/dehydratase family protein [Gammaproteobacteria bacterium]